MVDVAYRLNGGSMPVEHAFSLAQTLESELPWLIEEPFVGIHRIHVAASGNGWMRPEAAEGGMLIISRRTRLSLRIPSSRVDDARTLIGRTLDYPGHPVTLGEMNVNSLSTGDTLFSRYVAGIGEEDEGSFLERAKESFELLGIRVFTNICGLAQSMETPTETISTRSLLVAGLSPDQALSLQRSGLGPHRLLGCGLFIPHRGIGAVAD